MKKTLNYQAAKPIVRTIEASSVQHLVSTQASNIDLEALKKRFKNIDNTKYDLQSINVDGIGKNLSLSFKSLTALKNDIARLLNDGNAILPEVLLPKLEKHPKADPNSPAKLSLLICDESDIHLGEVTDADIYFKLPDAYKRDCTKYVDFLNNNPRLIPWFPPVLIGKDYDVAVNILEQVKPALIVTNNTGIANRAFELGIQWIAGPFLNTTKLLCTNGNARVI